MKVITEKDTPMSWEILLNELREKKATTIIDLFEKYDGAIELVAAVKLITDPAIQISNRLRNAASLYIIALANVEVIKQYSNFLSFTGRDSAGRSALLVAAKTGRSQTVNWLLSQGYGNFNDKDKYGRNAFLVAVANGRTETVDFLLENYPFLRDSKDNENYGALELACFFNEGEMLEKLMRPEYFFVKNNPSFKNELLFAAIKSATNETTTLKMLTWNYGFELNQNTCNEKGENALLIAIKNDALAVFDILIKPDTLGGYGFFIDMHEALAIAIRNDSKGICTHICKNYIHESNFIEPLLLAQKLRNIDILKNIYRIELSRRNENALANFNNGENFTPERLHDNMLTILAWQNEVIDALNSSDEKGWGVQELKAITFTQGEIKQYYANRKAGLYGMIVIQDEILRHIIPGMALLAVANRYLLLKKYVEALEYYNLALQHPDLSLHIDYLEEIINKLTAKYGEYKRDYAKFLSLTTLTALTDADRKAFADLIENGKMCINVDGTLNTQATQSKYLELEDEAESTVEQETQHVKRKLDDTAACSSKKSKIDARLGFFPAASKVVYSMETTTGLGLS